MKITVEINVTVNGQEVLKELTGPQGIKGTDFGAKDGTMLCGTVYVDDGLGEEALPSLSADNILAMLADVEDTVFYKGQYRTIKQIVELIRQERFDKEAAKHLEPETVVDERAEDFLHSAITIGKKGDVKFSNPRLFFGTDSRTPDIVLCKQRGINLKAPVTKKIKSNWVSYHDEIDGACKIPLTYGEARMLEELHGVAAASKVSPKASDLAKQFGATNHSLAQIKWQLKNKFKRAGLTVPVLNSRAKGKLHYFLNPLFRV